MQHKLEEKQNTRKARKDKRKTECSINRRNGCGICGSLNICLQGVAYCNWCGDEKEFLAEGKWWWYADDTRNLSCNCKAHYRYASYVGKCMDCGAVMAKVCPNGKTHDCWTKLNKRFCLDCGYRR